MIDARDVARRVEEAHRSHWATVLAATVRLTRDIDLAEDCAQDAFVQALRSWPDGVPDNAAGWLTTVAKRQALDRLRREQTLRRKLPLLLVEEYGGDRFGGTRAGRPAASGLHLLPPCPGTRLPAGADPAADVRPDDCRDRQGAAREGDRGRGAGHPREAEDRGRRSAVPVADRRAAAGASRHGADRRAPGLHRRTHGGGRRPDQARSDGAQCRSGSAARRAAARRAGDAGAACADPVRARLAARRDSDRRASSSCLPTRTARAGTGGRCTRDSH